MFCWRNWTAFGWKKERNKWGKIKLVACSGVWFFIIKFNFVFWGLFLNYASMKLETNQSSDSCLNFHPSPHPKKTSQFPNNPFYKITLRKQIIYQRKQNCDNLIRLCFYEPSCSCSMMVKVNFSCEKIGRFLWSISLIGEIIWICKFSIKMASLLVGHFFGGSAHSEILGW
jgi:hypothetical protein